MSLISWPQLSDIEKTVLQSILDIYLDGYNSVL
jgi:hypothetical protein